MCRWHRRRPARGRHRPATVGTTVRATVLDSRRAAGPAVGRALGTGVGATVRAAVLDSGYATGAAVRRTLEVVYAFTGALCRFAHRSSCGLSGEP